MKLLGTHVWIPSIGFQNEATVLYME